jgi:hypothetical protein
MNRRLPTSAQAVAASLRRLRTPQLQGVEASGLTACVLCGRDFVVPVQWEPVGDERWWMFLRCAECGTSREVTVSNDVAERYDEELARGMQVIGRAAHRLEHVRMTAEADAFAAALQRGLIEPADFAR